MSDLDFVKFEQWTEPSSLPADIRHKLILMRTAFAAGNQQEAHHWLYSIACPSFSCYDPFAAIEGRKCSCGPHQINPQDLPTAQCLEAILQTK